MEKIQNLIKECIFKKATKVYLIAESIPIIYGDDSKIVETNQQTEFSNEDLTLFLSLFTADDSSSKSEPTNTKRIIDWDIPNFGIIKIVAICEEKINLTLYMPSGYDLFLQEVNIPDFDISMSPSSKSAIKDKNKKDLKSILPPPPVLKTSTNTESTSSLVSKPSIPVPSFEDKAEICQDNDSGSLESSSSSTSTNLDGIDIDFNLTSKPNSESNESLSKDKNLSTNDNENQDPKLDKDQTPSEISLDDSLDVSAMFSVPSTPLESQDEKKEEASSDLDSSSDSKDDMGINLDDMFLSNLDEKTSKNSETSQIEIADSSLDLDTNQKGSSESFETSSGIDLDGLFDSSSQSSNKEEKPQINLDPPPLKKVNLSAIPPEQSSFETVFHHLETHTSAYIYEDNIVCYKTEKGFEKLGTSFSKEQIDQLNSVLTPSSLNSDIYSYGNSYYLKSDLGSGFSLTKLKTEILPSSVLDTNLFSPFLSYSSGIIFSRGNYNEIKAQDIFINFVNENFEKFILDFDNQPSFYHRNHLAIIQRSKHNSCDLDLFQNINQNVVDIVCCQKEILDQNTLFTLLKLATKTLVLVHTNYSSKSNLLNGIKQIIGLAPWLEEPFASLFLGVISLGDKNEIDHIKKVDHPIKKVG